VHTAAEYTNCCVILIKLILLCRRANKNPSCLEKRAKMQDILKRDIKEDSSPGTPLRLFLFLM